MSLLTMPIWLFISGIAALAAVVTALQFLRHRYRQVVLATNQFWATALQNAPARQIVGKFRHFWAWLLVLLLALLMWLVIAEPHMAADKPQRMQLFYLDASAIMQEHGRFEQARQALLQSLQHTPVQSRRVLLADANRTGVTTILAPGEPVVLMEKRLDATVFVPQPSALPSWLAQQIANESLSAAPQAVDIHIFGGPAVPVPPRLAANLSVTQQAAYQVNEPNVGIVALAQQPAASGEVDKRDVYFRIATNMPVSKAPTFKITSDLQANTMLTPQALGSEQFILRNLAANGQTLSIELTQPDALNTDNHASIQLAQASPITVKLDAKSPVWLQQMLKLNVALQLLTTDDPAMQPEVAVMSSMTNSSLPASIPTLVLVQGGKVQVQYVAESDSPEQLKSVIALLDNGVPTEFTAAAHRAVQLPVAWFNNPAEAPRMLPVVVSRLLGWLADSPCLKVSARLSQAGLDACSLTQVQSKTAVVARQIAAESAPETGLLDSNTTQYLSIEPAKTLSEQQAPATSVTANLDIATWSANHLLSMLLVIILSLLTVEWLALRRNLIP
ncbi:hypothetical protein [Shewanella dokdonensis]|uniref:Aerotolerance regulator N-terminal domain-containing protein n=1 Tax=Shewanella dokdonensis TaxID=712036 RepID=A0ABX8DB53_9GAMM|nr:hypothetical protein [Shewanella dokdonensis]MCL1075268.1 hypothetical protein [Shewanella dokdonensis]QVK21986.1 hypothetical protein KHX94_10840 [Shewanella dokdonensis]